MSAPSKFEIRLMNKNDYDQVLSLLTNSFFQDEPVGRCIHLTNTSEFSNNVINDCLADQCSFVAYDKETNQIVGICLNEIIDKNATREVIEYHEQLHFMLQLFNDVHKKVNIYDELNANTLLHVFIISVDKIARGQNLASHLISKSIEHAKNNLKVDGAYAEVTNIYSLRCFKQQEFEIYDELIYVDYNAEHLASMNDKMYDRCYLVARKF